MPEDIGQVTKRIPRVWIDWYFDLWRDRYVIGSVASGGALFLIGLAIAWQADFLHLYVRCTPATYLCSIGITWVAAWLGWGSRSFRHLPDQVRGALSIREDEFALLRDRWIRQTYNNWIALVGFVVFFPLTSLLLWQAVNLGHLPSVPSEWSQPPHLVWKFLVLELYLASGVGLLVSVVVGIFMFCVFAYRISRQPLIPMLELAATRLRRVTSMGIQISLAWSVGLVLLFVFLRPANGLVSIALLVVLVVLGAAAFLLPQWWLHRDMEQTKQALLSAGWEALSKCHYGEAGLWTLLSVHGSRETYQVLLSIGQARTWLYDPADFLQAAGTWLLPVLTFFLQGSVSNK